MNEWEQACAMSRAWSRVNRMNALGVAGYLAQHYAIVEDYPAGADRKARIDVDARNRERAARYMAGLNEQSTPAALEPRK
jgi:hypothetical protein